eukprot:1149671-Pelagomonas_calceolata.AAC.7
MKSSLGMHSFLLSHENEVLFSIFPSCTLPSFWLACLLARANACVDWFLTGSDSWISKQDIMPCPNALGNFASLAWRGKIGAHNQ